MGSDNVFTWDQVREAELDEIVARRNAAGLKVASDPARQRAEAADSLVGLAFSGGGLRSSSFNLGLLQALEHRGLLRYVDYLATVSGGGYIGSYLTSYTHHLPEGETLHNAKATFPLRPQPDGSQPPAVRRFLGGGQYLSEWVKFTQTYLVGWLLNAVVLASGGVAVCVFVAWLWRFLDSAVIADLALVLTDGHPAQRLAVQAVRPFWPAALLFLIWALASGWSTLAPQNRLAAKVARGLLVAGGIAGLIGATVWLATPNINFLPTNQLDERQYLRPPPALILPWIGVVLVGLLPFFRPDRLLQSGTRPQRFWEPWVFRFTSACLLVGLPLVGVYVFARHDFTGWVRARGPEFKLGDVIHWPNLWEKIHAEAKHSNPTDTIGGILWEDARNAAEDATSHPLFGEVLAEIQQPHAPHESLWVAMPQLSRLQAQPVPFQQDATQAKEALLRPLNKLLTNRELPAIMRRTTSADFVPRAAQELPEGQRLLRLWEQTQSYRLSATEAKELNRLLIEAYYPNLLRSRQRVTRSQTIKDDQYYRLLCLGVATVVFFISAWLVDLNRTSIHGFYRDRLAFAYLDPLGRETEQLPLAGMTATRKGAPYQLLIGAVLNAIRDEESPAGCANRPGLAAGADRGPLLPTHGFLLSKLFCGTRRTGYRRTADCIPDMDLAKAMAISGAALTPLGVSNALVATLMTVANFRLGQWLPHPGRCPRGSQSGMARPTFLTILGQAVSVLARQVVGTPEWQPFLFVTDGGYHENLGLGELLRRQCSLILVSDAGADPHLSFACLTKLYRRARLRGVRLLQLARDEPLDRSALVPDPATGWSERHFLAARVSYPGSKKEGLLVYVRPSFTRDEEFDLLRFRDANPDFPNDNVANQFFTETQVEAYRQLGYHIGEEVCRVLPAAGWEDETLPHGIKEVVARLGKDTSPDRGQAPQGDRLATGVPRP